MAKDTDIESTVRIDSQALINEQNHTSEDLLSPDTFDDISEVSFSDADTMVLPTQESIDFDELNDEFEVEDDLGSAEEVPSAPQKKVNKSNDDEHTSKPIHLSEDMMIKDNDAEIPSFPTTDESASQKPSQGIGKLWALLILLSLFAALGSIWMSLNTQMRIDELAVQLEFMENTAPTSSAAGSNNDEELMDMHEQLDQLEQRFTQLKVQLASSSHQNVAETQSTVEKSKPETSPVVISPTTPVASSSPAIAKSPAKKEVVKKVVKQATKQAVKPMPKPLTTEWQVVISSHNTMKKAKAEQERKSIKAIKTHIQPVMVKGKQWYRVVATGFANKQEAMHFTQKLKQQGIPDAWIQHIKP